MFDEENRSLKAQIALRDACLKLQEAQIEVYISHGNHDFLKGNRYPIEYPENVHIFETEIVNYFPYKKNNITLANIYGFSYKDRVVTVNKTVDYFPVNVSVIPYHIAMLHGSLQTNQTHNVYAPFQLPDFERSDFDYWALGHIHKREILKKEPYVVYPGNIQGRHIKELDAKGCYEVNIKQTGVNTKFLSLAPIEFKELSLDISKCQNIYELQQVIENKLKEFKQHKFLIRLKLTSLDESHKKWEQEGRLDDLLEIINQACSGQNYWNYIFHFKLHIKIDIDESTLKKGNHFQGELLRMIEDSEVSPYVTELYQHKQARKFLESLTEEEAEEIKSEAKQLLISELLLND